MAVFQNITTALQDGQIMATIALGLFLIYLIQILVKNLRVPAGPWGLPIVGYGPFLGDRPTVTFDKLAKKYGEVYSVNLGGKMMVMINSYEMYKEIFSKQADNFTGLVPGFSSLKFVLEPSVFQVEGDSWKEQRKFIMTCFREFGVGRVKTEKNIQEEAQIVLQILRDSEGKPFDFLKSRLLGSMTFNVIASLVLGRRFDYDDAKLKDFVRQNEEWLHLFSQTNVVDMFPILRFLPHKLTGVDEMLRYRGLSYGFVDEVLKEHEEDFDENDIRDVTDLYLKARMDLKKKGQDPENTIFSREYVLSNLGLIMVAGTDDTSLAFSWIIKMTAFYPEAQKKMQDEMDRVIGRQRLPSWTDKNQLPYVEAFLLEAIRVSNNLPVSPPHSNFRECTVKGYTFPERTCVVGNYFTIHNDAKIWSDPEKFRPERFIGEDGKINKMKDHVLLFGAGHRSCIGESVARMELFIFTAAIIQSFTLQAPPGEEFNLDCTETLQRRLKSCIMCAIPRD